MQIIQDKGIKVIRVYWGLLLSRRIKCDLIVRQVSEYRVVRNEKYMKTNRE